MHLLPQSRSSLPLYLLCQQVFRSIWGFIVFTKCTTNNASTTSGTLTTSATSIVCISFVSSVIRIEFCKFWVESFAFFCLYRQKCNDTTTEWTCQKCWGDDFDFVSKLWDFTNSTIWPLKAHIFFFTNKMQSLRCRLTTALCIISFLGI